MELKLGLIARGTHRFLNGFYRDHQNYNSFCVNWKNWLLVNNKEKGDPIRTQAFMEIAKYYFPSIDINKTAKYLESLIYE